MKSNNVAPNRQLSARTYLLRPRSVVKTLVGDYADRSIRIWTTAVQAQRLGFGRHLKLYNILKYLGTIRPI